MQIDNLQGLQRKLERRVNVVRKSTLDRLAAALSRFFVFVESDETLCELLDHLKVEVPTYIELYSSYKSSPDISAISREEEIAAIGYAALRDLSRSEGHPRNLVGSLYAVHVNDGETHPQQARDSRSVDFFIDTFLEPFYVYLDEQLNNHYSLLGLLRKYKHRCEWFERKRLLDEFSRETRLRETHLAIDLYKFLFEEGVRFSIEPSSLDGEIDLIAAQDSDEPLLADAKIFKGDNKSAICDGFGQIYRYANKYNEPNGYLVIFNISDIDLVFDGSDSTNAIPCIQHNHKTIYLLVVDICEHPKPTSKRGKIRAVTITKVDLIRAVEANSQ